MISLPRLGDSFLASESFFFSGLIGVIYRIFSTSRSFTLLIRFGLIRCRKCTNIDGSNASSLL
jgi:hypothetical protein